MDQGTYTPQPPQFQPQSQQPQNQPERTDRFGKLLLVIAVTALVTAVIVGTAVYWLLKSSNETTINNLEQQVSNLQSELQNEKQSQELMEAEPPEQQVKAIKSKTFPLPEVQTKVTLPGGYELEKSDETNRRGSFVSYDLEKIDQQTPYITELQFFSENSISDFMEKCADSTCFFGDYPDLARYNGQKTAFLQKRNYGKYELDEINGRNWFVSSHDCTGDTCVIREYTTFLEDTKLDVWIMMASDVEEHVADNIFTKFKIE